MYAGDEQLFAALEAGASAFVAKDAPSDDVVAAARHALRLAPVLHRRRPGRRHAAPDVPQRGPSCPRARPRCSSLLAEGFGVSAIARQLFVSESTAKTHISKIYEKLGAANRAQAIMNAMRSGPPVRRSRPV